MTKTQIMTNFIVENAVDIFRFAFLCDTEEKAEDFISILYKLGCRWSLTSTEEDHFSNDKIITKWKDAGKNTCYSINVNKIIFKGRKQFFENQGKEIVTYDKLFKDASDFDLPNDNEELKKDFISTPKDIISETQKLEESSGLLQIQEKKCPECGSIIKNGQGKFCMECGFKIPEDFFDIINNENNEENESTNGDVVSEKQDDTQNLTKDEITDVKTTVDKTKQLSQLLIITFCVLIALVIIVFFANFIINRSVQNDFSKFTGIWEQVSCLRLFGGY